MTRERSLDSLTFDIDSVIFDMNREFNPLHKDFALDYKVEAARDGYVLLTLALPDGMTKVFSSMLESMSGLFHYMHIKSRSAKASASLVDLSAIQSREQRLSEFTDLVCSLFDGYIGQGRSVKESLSLTNLTLKERSHPWATYDTISRVIRSTGRFRKDYYLKHDLDTVHKSTGRPVSARRVRSSRGGVPVGPVVGTEGR